MKTTKLNNQRRVIIYSRVSTDEQAERGFSLQSQKERLIKYCGEHGHEIVHHFVEDYSAKDFNRPEFQRMLNLLQTKVLKADIFLTIRQDRYSRNLLEAMLMDRKLLALGVERKSVENDFDLEIPENYLPHILNMVMPEVENRRRSLNTTNGMRQAQKEGRWMATAPRGYSNVNRNGNKSIEPNSEAKYVVEIFERLSTRLYSIEEVRKNAWKKGFKISASFMYKLIRNYAYCGKIKIKAWKDEPEEIVEGQHEAIVEEGLFQSVQHWLDGRTPTNKIKFSKDERLPLRGYLKCTKCGNPLTGSFSSGRTKKYGYYHCQNGCKERVNSEKANNDFLDYLNGLQVKNEVLSLYYLILQDVFTKDKSERLQEIRQLNIQIEAVQKRLDETFDRYIEGMLTKEHYQRGTKRYEEQKQAYISQRQELEIAQEGFMETVKFGFGLLKDLPKHYENSPVEVKHKILGSIFPEKLVYDGENYRTTQLNEVLALLCTNINGFGENKKGRNVKNDKPSSWVTPAGFEPATLRAEI